MRGWTLVLHDWGGLLGAAWARRNPGVVERMVVLNSVAFRLPGGFRVPFYLRLIRDVPSVAGAVHATNAFARVAVRVGARRRLDAGVRRAYLLPCGRRDQRREVVEFVRCVPRGDTDPLWEVLGLAGDGAARALTMPLFVGWGMKDPVFTPRLVEEWERRFPHATVRRYPQAGHFVMEDAAEELGGDVLDFMNRTEGR